MKNSAKWEVRVGLLLGLAFIIAFGMILSELRDPVAQSGTKEQTPINDSYYKTTQPPMDSETYLAEDQLPDPIPVVNQHPETSVVSRDVRVDMTRLEPAKITREMDLTPTGTRLEPRRTVRQEPSTKTYRVVERDTLYKIAEKSYGPGKGTLWRRIYKANRGKLSNPSAIKPGQTLVIPPLQNRPVSVAPREVSQQEALNHIRSYVAGSSASVGNRSASATRFYVVRPNDNLTKIARRYFNDTSSASVNKIFQANRDKLSDPDDVAVGMKLRIPAD